MNTLTADKFLTDDERKQLVCSLEKHRGERDSLLIRLALYTGGRSCEVLALRPCDFGKRCVTIRAAKGSNNRTIYFEDKRFFKELLQYIVTRGVGPHDRIFPISTRHFRRIWDYWRPNPNKGTHALRHTAATMLYINTKDIHLVKTFTGHKQINNTMMYLEYVEGQRSMQRSMRGMWRNSIETDEGEKK